MKKKILFCILAALIAGACGLTWARERTITVYREGEDKAIQAKEARSYTENGWFKSPVCRIYNKNGETIVIPEKHFEKYDNGEWGKEPFLPVYHQSGEKQMVPISQYESYLNDDWYKNPPDSEGLFDLKEDIETFLKTEKGTWGVFIQDLKTREFCSINETNFYSASLVKLFTMAATYQEIENGNLKQDDSINHQLNLMVTQSSNEACNALTRKNGQGSEIAGFDKENEIAALLNCEFTERGSYIADSTHRAGAFRYRNHTSPRDCGKLLKAIYDKELVSEKASEEMLDLLLAQTRRWKIPSGVPEGTKVANKTGETDTINSDVAIVFSPGGDYIICVLGSGYVANGTHTIQTISQMTYEYFN